MELRINKGKHLAVPLAFVTCGRLAVLPGTVCHAAVCSRPADEFVPIEFTSESDLLLLVGLTHCKQRGGLEEDWC